MKDTALDVLKIAKRQGVNAFIGGGYVRDTLLNVTPKDIDVFVLGHNDLTLAPYGYDWPSHLGGSGDNLREDVIGIEKYENKDLDIIYLSQDSYVRACNNFDLSICQCYGILSEDESSIDFYVSEDFEEFQKNNIIYQYSNIKTTQSHIDRVKEKYPDAEYKVKSLPFLGNKFNKVEN
jgi:hypothetical protein